MPSPFNSVICVREEGMIHFFYRSHAKKPESGLFSDWIGNNTDDLRCSDWPKRRHPLVVVDFSLHFCLRNEQWIHTRVRYEISAGSVFLPVWKMWKGKFHPLKYFPFHRILKIAVKNSPIIWMQFDQGHPTTIFGKYLIERRFDI